MNPSLDRVPRLALLVALSTIPLASCSKEVHTYTLHAEVVQLPTSTSPEVLLRHEAIDGWRTRDGEVVGMDPMTMGFPPKPGLDLGQITPGDLVEAVLEVDWDARPPIHISWIADLPAGSKLDFRPADPTRAQPPSETPRSH